MTLPQTRAQKVLTVVSHVLPRGAPAARTAVLGSGCPACALASSADHTAVRPIFLQELTTLMGNISSWWKTDSRRAQHEERATVGNDAKIAVERGDRPATCSPSLPGKGQQRDEVATENIPAPNATSHAPWGPLTIQTSAVS